MKLQWQQKFNSNPPKSAQTLKMVLDWYSQDELRINKIIAKLEDLTKQKPAKSLSNGTKIIKTWRGKRYEVALVSDGYIYEGICYKSLSKIAKVITGTHQSGNIFFGVTSHRVKK